MKRNCKTDLIRYNMRKLVYSITLVLGLFVTGCGDGKPKVSLFPQIDVNADYPVKDICLQDVAKVSYIPLETKDDFLLSDAIGFTEVSSGGIVCTNADKVYLFHPDGRTRFVLDKKGEGPGEYRFAPYVKVDWEREEIFAHDKDQKAVLVYSLDGNFKRQMKLGMPLREHDFVSDNNGHFVLYREKEGNLEEGKIEPPYRPVILLSQNDGKVDSLSYLQDYYTTMFMKMNVGDNAFKIKIPDFVLKCLNGEVYLNEVASDTIYRLVGKDLEPFATRVPSVKNDVEGKYLLKLRGIASSHYFFRLQEKEFSMGNRSGMYIHVSDGESKELMYDVKTGEICSPNLIHKEYQADISFDDFRFDICDENKAYMILQALDLIEALEAGELSGELKALAENLKEDDNPVLMLVEFKE